MLTTFKSNLQVMQVASLDECKEHQTLDQLGLVADSLQLSQSCCRWNRVA